MDLVLVNLLKVLLIVLDLYQWVVFINVGMSWLVSFNVINTSNQFVYMVMDFTYRATEPLYRRIRMVLPNMGGLDLSPIVVLLALFLSRVSLATCCTGSKAMAGAFFDGHAQGLNVRVRLQPAGRADQVQGLTEDADGQMALKVSVTQAPEGGKANAALIKLLAKEWRVAKTTLEVVKGLTSRSKVLRIAGDADDLSACVTAWAKTKGFET